MKLTFEQIKAVTVGAMQITEVNGEFHFAKMTAEQLEAFRAISQAQFNNASATTGIRLDFHTDAAYIKYAPLTSGKYELEIDGLLTNRLTATAGEEVTYCLPNDQKTHRVTLHLPSHGTPGGLAYLELSDGATIARHKFDRKFLIIGDSITQGWKTEIDTLSYAYRLSDHFNAESIIQGTGSACFNETTIEKLDFDPDTVFVAYGTNDAGGIKALEEIRDRARGFLTKLQGFYPDARFVVITPIWCVNYDAPRAFGSMEDFGKAIGDVARLLGMTVVRGEDMVPPIASLFIDNVHPNDVGFAFYAHNLIKAINK
jgi:lysophospholipase L1-like esterase